MKFKKLVYVFAVCAVILTGCSDGQSKASNVTEYDTAGKILSENNENSDVLSFDNVLTYKGKMYFSDSINDWNQFQSLTEELPINKDFHREYLKLDPTDHVLIYDMLIDNDYIYYTVDDRTQGFDDIPRLQLWKTSLEGGNPTLLYKDCEGDSLFMMNQGKIFFKEFQTGKGLFIDFEGNVMSEIPKDTMEVRYLLASENKLFAKEYQTGNLRVMDFSGTTLQSITVPGGQDYRLDFYDGSPVVSLCNEPYTTFRIPEEGNELVEIAEMNGKGYLYEITNDGFYYIEDGFISYYSNAEKQSKAIVELNKEEKLETLRQVDGNILYETYTITNDEYAYKEYHVYLYDLSTNENKKVSDYMGDIA